MFPQYGIRFENNEQAETFVYQMAEEVSRRLKSIDMRGRSITLRILTRDPSAPVEAPKVCSNNFLLTKAQYSPQFLGHGMCEAHNKQTPLIAPGGRATSDDKVIGEHAWRLLKSFNFDPKELRGVAIQIQKLEKASGPQDSDLGQAVLPFHRVEMKKQVRIGEASTSRAPQITVHPPSSPDDIQIIENPAKAAPPAADHFDLPSFSQVDMSVFEALPEDLRKELEDEYKRRSATPAPAPALREPTPMPEPPPPESERSLRSILKRRHLSRITRQLAPRNRPVLTPPANKFFGKRVYASSIAVTERELRRYGIDPSVFAALPPELQREQLAARRAPGVTVHVGKRKVLKPLRRRIRNPGIVFPPAPPPKAVFRVKPTLKQQGKNKGEKLCFSEVADVQDVVGSWVGSFVEDAPNQRDVDSFAKFLVRSVEGAAGEGIQRAIAVVKWWLVLLRRHFGVWENVPELEGGDAGGRSERVTSEYVGRAWWRAFREVKGKMDAAARKKFGGCLSLK